MALKLLTNVVINYFYFPIITLPSRLYDIKNIFPSDINMITILDKMKNSPKEYDTKQILEIEANYKMQL